MNAGVSLRHGASRYHSYICRPCLRRYLQTSNLRRASSDPPQLPASIDTTQHSLPKRKTYKKPPRSTVTPDQFKPYTPEELATLRKSYTPAQMAAIEAGEEAIDPKDIIEQGLFRTNDPWAIDYDEDFAKIHPLLDKTVRAPESNYDPKLRFKTEDEIKKDFGDFVQNLPADPTGMEYQKFLDNYRLMVGKEEAERNPISYLAPTIPKDIPGLAETASKGKDEIQPALKRLMKQTGFSLQAIRSFRVKILVQHRVVNQTRMGKIQSMYFLSVAGNQKGLLGIGEGKSAEAEDARMQAQYAAIRNLQPIARYEQRTIYGDVKGKVGAVELELMHRPPGR